MDEFATTNGKPPPLRCSLLTSLSAPGPCPSCSCTCTCSGRSPDKGATTTTTISTAERLRFYRRCFHQLDQYLLEIKVSSKSSPVEAEIRILQAEVRCLEELMMLFTDVSSSLFNGNLNSHRHPSKGHGTRDSRIIENVVPDGLDLSLVTDILMLSSTSPWTIYVAERTQWQLSYVSPSVQRMLGWRPAELVGSPAWDGFHPDDIPALQQMLRQKDNKRIMAESCVLYRKLRKDHTYATVQATGREVGTRWYAWAELDTRNIPSNIIRSAPKHGNSTKFSLQIVSENTSAKVLRVNDVEEHEVTKPLIAGPPKKSHLDRKTTDDAEEHGVTKPSTPVPPKSSHLDRNTSSSSENRESVTPVVASHFSLCPQLLRIKTSETNIESQFAQRREERDTEKTEIKDTNNSAEQIKLVAESNSRAFHASNHRGKVKAEVMQSWSIQNFSSSQNEGSKATVSKGETVRQSKSPRDGAETTTIRSTLIPSKNPRDGAESTTICSTLIPSRPKNFNEGSPWRSRLSQIYNPSTSPLSSKHNGIRLLKGKKVLLVDDDVVNRTIGQRLLESVDCKVTVSCNGKEALDILQSHHPGDIENPGVGKELPAQFDVALMDLSMPVMDGIKAVELFREWEEEQEPPRKRMLIFAVTGKVTDGEMVKCAQSGFDEFVSKPLTVEKLLDRLSNRTCKDDNHGRSL